MSCSNRGGIVFLIVFKTRHALPLTFVRFSRPRTSRGFHAECPRCGRAAARKAGHGLVLDSDVFVSHLRPRQSRGVAIIVIFPRPRPRSQPVHIQHLDAAANCPQPSNVHAASAESLRPSTVRDSTDDAASPRPVSGNAQASSGPHSRQHHHPGESAYVLI